MMKEKVCDLMLDRDVFEVLAKEEEMRRVKHPEVDVVKFEKYFKSVGLLEQFLDESRGRANVDDLFEPLSYHCIHIDLKNEEFDGTEIQRFAEISCLFDSMFISGSLDGEISICFLMEDIYLEMDNTKNNNL